MSVTLRQKRHNGLSSVLRDWRLYVMLILPLAFYIIFCYVPMVGVGIAYQCGFNDYSNFLRQFNKVVGISPREYRNQLSSTNTRK